MAETKINWTYILGGLGAVALALLAVYMFRNKDADSEGSEDIEQGANQQINTGFGTVNTGASPINTGGGAVNTGAGAINTSGGDPSGGTKSGGTDKGTKINTMTITAYDPNSAEGKGIIDQQISVIENNPTFMAEIKEHFKIGKDLWQGLADGVWCSSGICRSIAQDCKRFYFDKLVQTGFDWEDGVSFENKTDYYAYSGIWTSNQKPSLMGDMQAIIDYADSRPNQTDHGFVDLRQRFPFRDFANETPFDWHGDIWRRHELKVLNNISQWCKNMKKEMIRLDDVVLNAALATLYDRGIAFTGINT